MLEQQLLQLLESTQALKTVIDNEQLCLKEKNFENLNSLLTNKQDLLKTIHHADKQLSTEENLLLISNDEQLSSLRNKIEEQLQACKKINEINGQLIEMSLKSNKHLMQILTQAKGQNSVTYDQKGLLNSASLLGKDIKA